MLEITKSFAETEKKISKQIDKKYVGRIGEARYNLG